MAIAIEIVFNSTFIDPEIIWENVFKTHPECFEKKSLCAFFDKEIKISQIISTIQKRGKPYFNIKFNEGVIHFTPIANHSLSFLEIESFIEDESVAFEWVRPFLGFDSFVSARVYDIEYEYWQNAYDPLQYEAAGKPYSHLPMVSNGLPFPLEKEIIDISTNLGRRELKEEYIEAIGSTMWIGNTFWKLTKTNQTNICTQDWIDCELQAFNVMQIKSAKTLFGSDEGEERIIQEKLRKALFPAP